MIYNMNNLLDMVDYMKGKEKDIKDSSCPPKYGSCPFMFYAFQPGEEKVCFKCGKTVTGPNITC